ncbi:MAG: menaquinol oxidoreductase [Acidobacteria bacterium]|nr:menaquinol oxidoreductase [Acidobacteriota bacterium]
MSRFRLTPNALIAAAAVVFLGVLISACSSDAGASPDQPLAFSHRIHGENEIDCAYCHEYVDRYAVAGIPRVQSCMDCHEFMEPEAPSADLDLLVEFSEAGDEIPWVRLYELPDYTHFNHRWHIEAEIDCATCHGDIGASDRATRHMVYDMDWCMTCHEEQEASVDCLTCHT